MPGRNFDLSHANRLLKQHLYGTPQNPKCDTCSALNDGFPCLHDGTPGRCLWCAGTSQECSLSSHRNQTKAAANKGSEASGSLNLTTNPSSSTNPRLKNRRQIPLDQPLLNANARLELEGGRAPARNSSAPGTLLPVVVGEDSSRGSDTEVRAGGDDPSLIMQPGHTVEAGTRRSIASDHVDAAPQVSQAPLRTLSEKLAAKLKEVEDAIASADPYDAVYWQLAALRKEVGE